MTHVVIIGGGPAGIAAATEAARFGAQVTLVERDHLGGRATWHSLLPSKAWLSAADRVAGRANAQALGLIQDVPNYDFPALLSHIAALKRMRDEQYRKRLLDGGVRLITGSASFEDARTVRVECECEDDGEMLHADRVIIASGSGPIMLPNVSPDGQHILAPRVMSKLTVVPDSLIVIGAGVTGSEFAYMFNMLGVDVTLVTDIGELLPRSDPDISAALDAAFRKRGMTIYYNSPVASAEVEPGGVSVLLQNGTTHHAEMAFIAIGRRPYFAGLKLENAGLTPSPDGLMVDGFGRSEVENIYAAGDVTGAPMTANKGMAQGHIAGRHAVDADVGPYNPATVIEAVYTNPEVAQIGMTEAVAHAQGRPVKVIKRYYRDNLKAHLIGGSEGMVKIVVNPDTGGLLGGAAVGVGAVEGLTPLAVAMQQRARASDLAGIFAGHPTLGELLFEAVRGI